MVTLHHTIVHGMVFAIRQKGLAPCRYFFRTLGDSPTSTHLCEVGLHVVLPDNLPTLPRQMEMKLNINELILHGVKGNLYPI